MFRKLFSHGPKATKVVVENPNVDFFTFDFETANSDPSSICQMGIATFARGSIQETFCISIDPQCRFDHANSAVHGIHSRDVVGSPNFKNAIRPFEHLFLNNVAVSHSAFDKNAIHGASALAGIECPLTIWLDSMKVVRTAWPELFGKSGYGLKNVCSHFGIEFTHHNAGEDARATAIVLHKAIEHSGAPIEEWLKERKKNTPAAYQGKKIAAPANPNGRFAGEVVVFTGELSLNRIDAASRAAESGMTVANSVTKKTTLLVVGEQDLKLLAGHKRSTKHRKAEEYISNGQQIRIIDEGEFLCLFES